MLCYELCYEQLMAFRAVILLHHSLTTERKMQVKYTTSAVIRAEQKCFLCSQYDFQAAAASYTGPDLG